jgi:hypothetical protein
VKEWRGLMWGGGRGVVQCIDEVGAAKGLAMID